MPKTAVKGIRGVRYWNFSNLTGYVRVIFLINFDIVYLEFGFEDPAFESI
jgi:hypothetical protein